MNYNKTTLLLTLLLILSILLTPIVFGDAEQYLTPGTTRDSTFTQDGTGMWTDRTPTEYTRSYNRILSQFPLVANVDGDAQNEIVILADNQIVILNYTYGVGLITEQSLTHGPTNYTSFVFNITPALFDTDSNGIYEIISSNISHFIMYSWNGTTIVINQSAAIVLGGSAPSNIAFQSPVIKCAQGIQFSSGNDTCVMPATIWDAGSGDPVFLVYDVNANIVYRQQGGAIGNPDNTFRNTHLADGDADGYLEAYFSRRDGGNGDLFVYELEISDTPVLTVLEQHALAPNRLFTDIIVSDLYGDGGSLDITWGFTSDGTNFDAYTISASDGTVKDASYCGVLTCPEGDYLSANMMVAEDTTYCDNVGDVFYYIRNYEESDPAPDTDTVMCVSQYSGDSYKRTGISNTQNFTYPPIIHAVSLHDSPGLLLPVFTTEGSTKKTLPALPDYPVLIPVDVEKSGSLDLIAMSSTSIEYLEDGYTNTNYEIVSLEWDTGNCVLQNELVGFTVSVQDVEEDSGLCYYTEKYSNNTLITNSSNVSISENSFGSNISETTHNYYADSVGTYLLDFKCEDQYHTGSPDVYEYTIIVGNTSDCNTKGQESGEIAFLTTTEESEEADFDDDIEELLDGLGIVSKSARNIIAIIAVFLIAVLIFLKSNSILLAVCSIPATLIIAFLLGLVSIFPLIVLIIFCIAVLTYLFMTGRGEV